jgi:hypothetical protein
MEAELSAYKKLVGELEFENRAMKALICKLPHFRLHW